MKRVLSSLLLVLLLLCGLTDRAEAFSTPPEKTASGSLSQNPDKRTYVDPLLVLELQRDREVWGYDLGLGVDVGPNLYAYVNQNPWSKFDPLGLYEIGGGLETVSFSQWKNDMSETFAGWGAGAGRGIVQLGELAGRIYASGIPDAPLRKSVDAKVVSTSEGVQTKITEGMASATSVDSKSDTFTDWQTVGEYTGPVPPVVKGLKVAKGMVKAVDSARDVSKVTQRLTPLADQVSGVADDAIVHFGPEEFSTIKPGAGGQSFNFNYDDISHLTPAQVEFVIGSGTKSGTKGGSKFMHVIDDADAAKAEHFGGSEDFPEFIFETEVDVSDTFKVQ